MEFASAANYGDESMSGTSGTSTTPTYAASSAIDQVIEAVIGLMNATSPFATVTRGALPTGVGITCEMGPSTPQEVYLDKNSYIPLDLALNGKHDNLQTLSDTLNTIIDTLSRKKEYTSGTGWQIVDITPGNLPRVIGREDNSTWLMAGDLVVKIYRKDD